MVGVGKGTWQFNHLAELLLQPRVSPPLPPSVGSVPCLWGVGMNGPAPIRAPLCRFLRQLPLHVHFPSPQISLGLLPTIISFCRSPHYGFTVSFCVFFKCFCHRFNVFSERAGTHVAHPRTTLAGSTRCAPEAGQPFKPHSLAARLPRRPLRDPKPPEPGTNEGPTASRLFLSLSSIPLFCS